MGFVGFATAAETQRMSAVEKGQMPTAGAGLWISVPSQQQACGMPQQNPAQKLVVPSQQQISALPQQKKQQ